MKRRIREEEETGELNIVPYLDIVVNLVMFLLLSMAGVLSLGVLDVGTPRVGEPDSAQMAAPTPQQAPFNLTVGITDQGFYVAGSGGILPGDTANVDKTRPPTIAKKGGAHDFKALTDLMAKIKQGFPNETRVILVAELDTAYDIIIQTMDACRDKTMGDRPKMALFPEVWLSMMQ
jgi:biopolymer transport protein TolR